MINISYVLPFKQYEDGCKSKENLLSQWVCDDIERKAKIRWFALL